MNLGIDLESGDMELLDSILVYISRLDYLERLALFQNGSDLRYTEKGFLDVKDKIRRIRT